MSQEPPRLLAPELAERVLARALARGGERAEVYAEAARGVALSLDDRKLERAQVSREAGAAVRVVAGDATYAGHVDGFAEPDLLRLADSVAGALRGDRREPQALQAAQPFEPQPVSQRPQDVPAERKAEILRECDERARGAGDEIAQVSAGYSEGRRLVQMLDSDGLHAGDDRTRVRLAVQCVARRGDRVETGSETRGGHRGFELLAQDPAAVADQAARQALTMLGADDAPAGRMAVVVGGGFGGVLFHEATGHGLEADAVQKGASVYAGKLGEQVAGELLTAYDDGRLPGEWGTDGCDDEGTPTRKTRVIDAGVLTSFLHDRHSAQREGARPTGNGRRESFRHLPIPRMTNTYIAPGPLTAEEVIAGVKRGFYAVSFAGGQVEPATGDFVFGVSEGYLIENGAVTRPLRGATLIGNGLDVLRKIDAIGNDFSMKTGFCGKAGQRVPVGTGQATVRIAELTVGGTSV